MKRLTLTLSIAVIVILFSGCSVLSSALRRVLPHSTRAMAQQSALSATIEPTPTAEPEPSPAPDTTTAEPTKAPPTVNPNEYTSTGLGIAFTLPDSWVGKYRVKEGDGYLTVYFKPEEAIDDGMGNFFSIVKKTPEGDYFLDSPLEFEANGTTYIFGTPTDVTYSEENPEYETFAKMQEDLPAIIQSLKASE